MLTSSLDLVNDLIVNYFVSDLERLILLVLLASQQDIIHSEAPTVKLCDRVPSESKLGPGRNLVNEAIWDHLFRKHNRADGFYVCVFLLVLFLLRVIDLININWFVEDL